MNARSTPIASAPAAPQKAAPAAWDLRALGAWLAPRVPGLGPDLVAERMQGGQSNPSWLLRAGTQAWVLRAKPAPAAALLPSAHAIEREYRVLQALQGAGVPVPCVRVLCEDESVIGVAFYVMDFVPGRIFRDATLPEVAPAERRAYLREANRVLGVLHQVDWRARGLDTLGRSEGYHQRLIRRWTQQYLASRPAPVAAMDQLIDWLTQHIPAGADAPEAVCLTHGDYRLENLIFHPERAEIVAVLDWELCTLGHPLSDLAYSALAWHLPAGILRGYGGHDLPALQLPSEQDHVAWYVERLGLDPAAVWADWPFYLAFNLFRLSAILFGVGQREREGKASHASAREIAAMAEPVAQQGWAVAQTRGAGQGQGLCVARKDRT